MQVLLQELDAAREAAARGAARAGPEPQRRLQLAGALVATALGYAPMAVGAGSGGSGGFVASVGTAPDLPMTLDGMGAWAASSSSDSAVGCAAPGGGPSPLDALPYTLPRLLSRPPWSSSLEAVAAALLALAKAAAGEGGAASWAAPVHASLRALQDSLGSYAYDQQMAGLGWRRLWGAA